MKLIDPRARRLTVALPARPLTVEQQERRARIKERAELIQAGIAPPKSGVYGRPPKAKAA